MIAAATVVWLGSAAPDDDARSALDAWARARGLHVAAPTAEAAHEVPIDWTAADAAERSLGRAKEALVGLELETAERELARAEATLREHPELPQAAWLRAEVARAWSVRWLRSGDEERARRAWLRAAALDGGRAAGLGEKDYGAPERVTATVRLEGPGDVRLDGAPLARGTVTCASGEHALAVVRADGTTTWADWVSIAPGTILSVSPPTAPPCSSADVATARLDGDVVVAGGVRCARWVAAVAVTKGAVRVATCERGSCGPLVEWRVLSSGPWTVGPPRPEEAHGKWPAWATWTLAGVGVAGAVTAIVAASGALKPASTETHFVNGGVQIHSF